MMKFTKLFPVLLIGLSIIACNNDDDGDVEVAPPRDVNEVRTEDNDSIVQYLQTHYYNYHEFQNPPVDFDYQIKFDTITDANRDTIIPLIDQVVTEEVEFEDVPHTLYKLIVREGNPEAKPLLGQAVLVNYEGSYIDGEVFDRSYQPRLFETLGVGNPTGFRIETGSGLVEGMLQLLLDLGIGSGYVDNPDGTVTWNPDHGIGAVFMPSGLGYFNDPPVGSAIPNYSLLFFKVSLYVIEDTDQDARVINGQTQFSNDGIPSHLEDVDGDGDPRNDDTDDDGVANFGDPDDDGDGVLTIYEYDKDGDGIPDDYNNDGTPDYLDPDYPTLENN